MVQEGLGNDGDVAPVGIGSLRFAELLVANAFDGVYVIRGERYIYVNERFADILGYPAAHLVGPDFHFDVLLTERGRTMMAERYAARRQGLPVPRRYDMEARRGDGSIIEVEVSVTQLDTDDVISVLGVVRDVTTERTTRRALQQARADLSRKVEERTAELAAVNARLRAEIALHERTNSDLLRFVDLAAHDLQEPLRMIALYTSLLVEDCGPGLDDRGREYATQAGTSARQMHALIRDLQRYTELGIRQQRCEPVALDVVLDQALATLAERISAQEATIVRGELPLVNGDPQQLRQLLVALLDNALTYHGEAPPEITIGARRGASGWRVDIADNGIGIEDRYQLRVFEVFERLHGADHRPGTGIGLALSRKIAILHGGDLTLRSSPGLGSTFTIALPGIELPLAAATSAEEESKA